MDNLINQEKHPMNLLKELDMMILEKKEEEVPGTYVGARFAPVTVKYLKSLAGALGFTNPVPEKDFHTTIIFSRKKFPDSFEAQGTLDPTWKGTVTELEVFPTRSGTNALVLRYKCPEQKKRHEFLMEEYDATYDWDEYKIHVTLSYDCGDVDIKKLNESLEKVDLEISEEYTQPLDLEWTTKNDG